MTKPTTPEIQARLEYPQYDPAELEPYYSRHVDAMTHEGLHSKAAIAAQLAQRDKQNAKLELIIQALMTFDSPVTGGPCWCVRQRGSSTDKHGSACTMVRELKESHSSGHLHQT